MCRQISATAAPRAMGAATMKCAAPEFRSNTCAVIHAPVDPPVVCQSQVVLDAAAWVRDLPHTIQAIFFPRGGDVAKAREIHKQFVDHFGMQASDLPFLQLDVQNPNRPFETAILDDPGLRIPPAFSLTSNKCHALMSDATSKFWTLWGNKAWEKLPNGENGCWTDGGDFFENVLGGGQCDTNWYEGAKGNLGRSEMRPPFTAEAPALLGFDESIYAFCSTLVGQPTNFIKADGLDFNEELAQRCVDANINILRIISSTRKPWTMCQNLRWILCALTGKVSRFSVAAFPPAPHAPTPLHGHVLRPASRAPTTDATAMSHPCPPCSFRGKAIPRYTLQLRPGTSICGSGCGQTHGRAINLALAPRASLRWATFCLPRRASSTVCAEMAKASLISRQVRCLSATSTRTRTSRWPTSFKRGYRSSQAARTGMTALGHKVARGESFGE
jgi:hypothetical protein